MPDASVSKWKQRGNLYLWRYLDNTRNFPGWHLTADNEGCSAVAELIEMMLAARWSSEKELVVTVPTAEALSVPNNRGGEARWKSASSLLLKHPKDKVADDYFELDEQNAKVTFALGSQRLNLLKDCVQKIPEGKGDYSIDAGGVRLWFWWMMRN